MTFLFTGVTGMASPQSVLDCASGVATPCSFTVWGENPGFSQAFSLPGFNGERGDPVTGVSHLGSGYRQYNPALMRFHTPDSLSPFGDGGINPYVYCAGDPVNHTDPSGHLSAQAWTGIGLGIAGLLATVVTGGLAIAAAGGVVAALAGASTTALVSGVAGVAADVTAIASGATSDVEPQASSALGWFSAAMGGIGAGCWLIFSGRGKAVGHVFQRFWDASNGVASSPLDLNAERVNGYRILNNSKCELYDVEDNLAGWAIRDNHAQINIINNADDLNILKDKGLVHKFIFSEDSELFVGSVSKNVDPKNLSHPAIASKTGRKGIIAAGYLHRKNGVVYAVNHSGHYLPDYECLESVTDFIQKTLGVKVRAVKAGSFAHRVLLQFA